METTESIPNQNMTITTIGAWAHTFAGPTTSFLLNIKDAYILLDVGASPIQSMRDQNVFPPSITHIYISHLHSDHAGGLANFIFTRQLLGRKLDHLPTLHIYAAPAVVTGAQQLTNIQYPDRRFDIEWHTVDLGDTIPIEQNITMRSVENTHAVPCFGAVVSTGQLSVGFTSDTAPRDDHSTAYENCSVLIGESFGLSEDVGNNLHERGHSSAEDLATLATNANCKLVIPFHFDEHYLNDDRRVQLMERSTPSNGGRVIDPVTEPVIYIR